MFSTDTDYGNSGEDDFLLEESIVGNINEASSAQHLSASSAFVSNTGFDQQHPLYPAPARINPTTNSPLSSSAFVSNTGYDQQHLLYPVPARINPTPISPLPESSYCNGTTMDTDFGMLYNEILLDS